MKRDVKSMTREEVKLLMEELGEKAFRANQVFSWVHKGIKDFQEMSNISLGLRSKLEEKTYIPKMEIFEKLESKLDDTRKYLIKLEDGNLIESVAMVYHHGISLCISSQVGCRMGCTFCASTINGLVRNLRASEILGQITLIQEDLGSRISNIVMMGSGEPLDNLEEVKKFLDLVHDKDVLNIGYRHITISTCGVVPGIYEMAKWNIPINLALSLHSPTDEKRKQVMPIAKAFDLNKVIEACDYYGKTTGRRVTFEYSLIGGFNDSKEDLDLLVKLLKGKLAHVNLIPVNPIEERDYSRPSREKINRFKEGLLKNKIEATVRREMGKDINGACGQLRNSRTKG